MVTILSLCFGASGDEEAAEEPQPVALTTRLSIRKKPSRPKITFLKLFPFILLPGSDIKKTPQKEVLQPTQAASSNSHPFQIQEAQAFPFAPYRLLSLGRLPLGEATRRLIFSFIFYKCILVPDNHNKYTRPGRGGSMVRAQAVALAFQEATRNCTWQYILNLGVVS